MRTYYVSNGGSDSNAGTLAAPFSTLTKAASVAAANTQIAISRGSVFRETLTMPSASHVTVKAYGSGAAPIISASDVVGGLVSEIAGTEGSGEIASFNADAGNLTGVTVTQTGGTVVASTDFARSGSYSVKMTGNGTDNRVNVILTAGSTQGSGSRHYFFAISTATGSLKNNGELRIVRLQAGSTQQIYLSIFSNASGVPTTFTLNDNVGTKFLLATQPLSGYVMDDWNTVEIELKSTSSGYAKFWLNGVLQGTTPTVDLSGTAYTGLNKLLAGNDAFNNGFASSGKSIYIDDIKISASSISGPLNGGDPKRSSVTYATQPAQLFVDGVRGQPVATAASVTSYRQWSWVSNTLTVYGNINSTPPSVEASVRTNCIDGTRSSNATYMDLDLRNAAVTGLDASPQPASVVRRLNIQGAFVEGFHNAGNTQHDNGWIDSCTISDCGGTGIAFDGPIKGWRISNNTITNCCRLHDQQIGGHARQQYSAGIKYWGWGQVGYAGGMVFENNKVSGCVAQFDVGTTPQGRGVGIWIDESQSPTFATYIRNNKVYGCQSSGIFSEKSDLVQIINNLTYNNGTINYRANIHVQANAAGWDVINNVPATIPRNSNNNLVEHNTSYGGWWGVAVECATDGCLINSCITRNNISASPTNQAVLYTAGGGSNDTTHGTGNTYINNCLGAPASGMGVWGGSSYSTYASLQTASSGAITGSVSGDPLFTNAGTGDFSLQGGSPCHSAGTDGQDLGANVTLLPS